MRRSVVHGGELLQRKLKEISDNLRRRSTLSVGFLEGATYPDGTPVAYIAAINEFGGVIHVPEKTVSVFRKLNKDGSWAREGRFVKRKDANVETQHISPAHTITIPARPFFRGMIATHQSEWGPKAATMLSQSSYDVHLTLTSLGAEIVADLKQSIRDFSDPPNAPSTIRRKGFDSPLIDTGYMMSRVDQEVTEDT